MTIARHGRSFIEARAQVDREHEHQPAEAIKLVKDLKRLGMLDDALVIWGGEFGRTPIAQGDGRDHNPQGFTMWLAGGGVKGGMTYGETDDLGMNVLRDPVHVHDLQATVLHLLGLDHERLTFRYSGRDHRLTDVEGHVIREILG